MCFACGHEAGKAVAQAATSSARVDAPQASGPAGTAPLGSSLPIPSLDSPFVHNPAPRPPSQAPVPQPLAQPVPAPFFPSTPTPAAMPGVAPSFAPLPPLPPLPRSPSGAFVPGAPPSGPAAQPRYGAAAAGQGAPNLGPPSYAPPGFAPPHTTPPSPGGPAGGGQLPPPPITFPGTPTTGASRPRTGQLGGATPSYPTVVPPPRASPPSSPAASAPALALDPALERTADTERPIAGMVDLARRVWASPGAFALVFVVGFVVTFGPGALWKLRSPDLQALIDGGQANAVVALLEAREKEKSIGKSEWVLYGHAIAAAYGTYRRSDMLAKYGEAARAKNVDATALQNTIEALADPSVQKEAVAVLKLEWPTDLEPEARLQERTGDDNVLLRRGAVEALVARAAPTDMVRSARARVAVVDLRARACPTTAEGVAALKDLVAEKATAALRERKVADAVLDLQGDADLAELPCIDKKTVKALQQQVAALLEGG